MMSRFSKVGLALAAVFGLSSIGWADSEYELEIEQDDGELTIESESEGAYVPSYNVDIGGSYSDVRVGSPGYRRLETREYRESVPYYEPLVVERRYYEPRYEPSVVERTTTWGW